MTKAQENKVINTIDEINMFQVIDNPGAYNFADVTFKCKADFRNRNIVLGNFRNVVFEEDVYFDTQSLNSDNLYFQDATFNKQVSFKDISIPSSISFNRAKFLGDAIFESFIGASLVDFSDAVFYGRAIFDSAQFHIKSNFSNVKFNNTVSFINTRFSASKHNIAEVINFSNTTFSRRANFSMSKFYSELLFENAKFLDEVNFSKAEFHWHTKFSNVKFSGKATFKEAKFKFASNFYGATFENETDFVIAEFERATFNRSKFSGFIYFDYAKFSKDALFDEIEITGSLQFKRTQFLNNSNFRLIRVGTGTLNFENANFENFVDFSKSSFDNTNYSNVIFKSTVAFTNTQLEITDFTGAIFKEFGLFKNCKIVKSNRDSYRAVKHELLKQNNKIDALTYHEKEMRAYSKELKLKNWRTSFSEKFILFLNRISNGYGLNWIRGVGFTFVVALLFFIPYLLCLKNPYFDWGWESWPDFWEVLGKTTKYYIQFFYAGHKFNFMERYDPRGFAYILDMVGRIFITYGYYQTIQAFRKYGRW